MLFTSESVCEGHPDKLCDIISDTILDECLKEDPNARVAIECMVKGTTLDIAGESSVDISNKCVFDILDNLRYPFSIRTRISKQSPEISTHADQGAGDQGMMFGYASDETPDLMPAPIYYAHKLSKRLTDIRKEGRAPWLRPDGKTQITFEYQKNKPVGVRNVVVSAHCANNTNVDTVRDVIREEVIGSVLHGFDLTDTIITINPFFLGGPEADCGLTGRKIIVDTYGGMGRHGGGAFSGKDPTKVDRSGAYMARFVAKWLVKNGYAKQCEVQVAYCIGEEEPASVMCKLDNKFVNLNTICQGILFDFRPAAIIERFDLKRPIYAQTAKNGHFGHSEFPWEQV